MDTRDAELIDQIEDIRRQNNRRWMDLVRLAFELDRERAKAIMADICQMDGEVRRLTQELGDPPPPPPNTVIRKGGWR